MPWLLQQPVWTYANYLPVPQTSVATSEQVDLQQLALLIDKIQNTVDKSKLMLELEKEKTRFLSQFDEVSCNVGSWRVLKRDFRRKSNVRSILALRTSCREFLMQNQT
jgi:hypothetical protein